MANYNVYKCSDGKFVALGSLEPKFWSKFCVKVQRPDWTGLFLQKGEELLKLKSEVQTLFLAKTKADWVEYFKAEDICFTGINDLPDMENDAYLNERGMFAENEHAAVGKYKTINQPLKFKQTKFDNNWSAPDLGDDSASILKELNYSEDAQSELINKNIIKVKK